VRAQAPIDKGDGTNLGTARATARPLRLPDVDRMLKDSARIEHAGPAAPIRAWRDELTLAFESLNYAEAVLGGDVEILLHSLANRGSDTRNLVQDLSRAMAARPWGDAWSAPSEPDLASPLQEDRDLFTRSDLLMSAHQQMAYTDLRSRTDVKRVLRSVLEQLANLALRREAVEVRLQQIRAAIVQQYRDGEVSTRDWLG